MDTISWILGGFLLGGIIAMLLGAFADDEGRIIGYGIRLTIVFGVLFFGYTFGPDLLTSIEANKELISDLPVFDLFGIELNF